MLLVDPHEVSRAAIRALLQAAGLQVVGDVADADVALALGAEVAPDVVILDIEDGGPQALRSARARATNSSGVLPVLAWMLSR